MKPSTGILLGALVVAAIGLGIAWKLLAAPETPETRPGRATEPRAEDLVAQTAPTERATAAPSTEIEPTSAESTRTDRPDPPIHVRGHVLDALGTPISAVAVGVDGKGDVFATSDASGTFEFDLDRRGLRIVSKSDEWATVRFAQVDSQRPEREHLVIVARPIALSGRVVDLAGRPIAGAEVSVEFPHGAFAAFPYPLDSIGDATPAATTGPDGSFALARVPSLARGTLHANAPGRVGAEQTIPTQSATDLLFELREQGMDVALLEGQVVHADGSAAPNAMIHFARQEAVADEHGEFRLAIVPKGEDEPLVATMKGFQPAMIPEYGRVIAATGLRPPPVLLMLGTEPSAIAGHVLEVDGTPCSGWSVGLAGGWAVLRAHVGERVQSSTDERGAFRLEGLRDIPYVLQAWGPDGRMIRSDPIQAGTRDAELRCEPDAFIERIEGRVVSREGLPLAGAAASIVLSLVEDEPQRFWHTVKSEWTSKDGAFVLKSVPKQFTRLMVWGDSVQPTMRPIDEIDLSQPVEISVVRLCHFRFESGADAIGPQSIEVLDREGAVLELRVRGAAGRNPSSTAALQEGRSEVLSVSEDAARLLLYAGVDVLSSQPLRLVPGEVVTVRRER